MSGFTKTDARRIRRKLERLVEYKIENDCDHNCRDCALYSKIRPRKDTQCILNILQLCLKGEYDED